ncbi:hypothetical protein KAT80_03160 [Candidatus Pacearchaeota archaeon]|nr:hypothetical protein [Candidatus Pacearchaeota archaeon]
MTTFTRGERNEKPIGLTKGLLDNSMQYVKHALLGLSLSGLVMAGCTMTSEGRQFSKNMVRTYIQESVKEKVWNPERDRVDAYGNTKFRTTEEESRRIERLARAENEARRKAEPKFFTCNNYVDINQDKILSKEEYFGLGKKVFDLSQERFSVIFRNCNYTGKVIFKSWTNTGEFVGETEILCQKQFKVYGRTTGPEAVGNDMDFMDKIKIHGPGNYRITATLENGKTYFLNNIKIFESVAKHNLTKRKMDIVETTLKK